MRRSPPILLYFLFGFCTYVKVVASLSFTELFIFLAAPVLIEREWYYLRRNGILPFFWLSICLVGGCVVACLANHTPLSIVLRGMSVCCLMPCGIVVNHWLLRRNMGGFKWIVVGNVTASLLLTFIYGASEAMGWKHQIKAALLLPATAWYLQCPILYSSLAPIFVAGISMVITASGRGTAVQALAMAALVFVGGKKQKTMRRIGKCFYLMLTLAVVGAFAAKGLYRYAAVNDWLGEKQRAKYFAQTKGKTGMMALLMGGRMESFCGLIACVDKPIIGFGPWAEDRFGYEGEFLRRYGADEDYAAYLKRASDWQIRKLNLIPCHSVITELWLWYGMFGLLFCLYIVFAICRYIKMDCWVVPQWYFWLAALSPGFFWDLCFNPLSRRDYLTLFVVACLLVRAVRKGRQQLPVAMVEEINRNERR